MYLVQIQTKDSPINGKGVFTLENISKGEIVWKFESTHDKTLSIEEFNNLEQETRVDLKRVAYLSASSNRYVYPPEGDPARFTNHKASGYNLSVVVDPTISEEPYFVANRDVEAGEELTNNYFEFDETLKKSKPDWI